MWSEIYTIIIFGASIYFFYQDNFFLGIILLIWTIYRLVGSTLNRLIHSLWELTTHSEVEKKCNVAIELNINIAEVLKHKTVGELFEKLKERGSIKVQNQSEQVGMLIENYKKKYKNNEDRTIDGVRYVWEKVKFNIKNNLLWKNGEIDFNDSVYHELFIPYEYKGEKEEKERFFTDIKNGISIRVFVVNGVVKLQVGHFSKEFSPNIIKAGLDVYQTYITITSFPLMYAQYEIPEKYLNLSAYATESWKNMYIPHTKKEKLKDFTFDWKELNKEIRDYNYICGLPDDEPIENLGRFGKIIKGFNTKKEELLKKEGFKNLSYVPEEGEYIPDFLEDNDIHYANKYLRIFIANYNDYKKKRERYNYTDYWQETP